MNARGRASQIVVDYESVYKTTPGVPNGLLIPFISESIKASQSTIEDNTIRNSRHPAMPTRGNINLGGGLVVPVDEIAIGWWLKAMFGAPQTSGTGDPYTHTFKPGATQPSLVIEKGFTGITQFELLNGCKIGSMSFEFGGDSQPQMNMDILGAKSTWAQSSFDTTPTAITQTNYNMAQLSIKEGGAASGIITKGSLKIDTGLDGDQYAIDGTGTRADIPEGLVKASGSISAFFQDITLLNKAKNFTESSLEFIFANGVNRSLSILLPEIVYELTSPVTDGPKGILLELAFQSYWQNDASNSSIVATLKNGQASYA